EQPAQGPLCSLRLDLAPEGSGGKSPFLERLRWPRQQLSTNKSICRWPKEFARKHRSATYDAPQWPWLCVGAVVEGVGPAPIPHYETNDAVCLHMARQSSVVARGVQRELDRLPRWDAFDAWPELVSVPLLDKHEAASWLCGKQVQTPPGQ